MVSGPTRGDRRPGRAPRRGGRRGAPAPHLARLPLAIDGAGGPGLRGSGAPRGAAGTGQSYVSNLTGTWITAEQATDPGYWARHLREPVRFAAGVAALLAEPRRLLLEVGPGRTLSTLARPQAAGRPVVTSLRHPREERDDQAVALDALGRLWLAGATVDWRACSTASGGGACRCRPIPSSAGATGSPAAPRRRRRARGGTGRGPRGAEPGQPDADARPGISSRYVAPRSELEQAIAELWGASLGVARLGVDDDFFELGGSSLLAVRLAARLGERLGLQLDPHLLLGAPTVASLAAALAPLLPVPAAPADEAPPASASRPVKAAGAKASCLVTLQAGDSARPPLFLVHPAGGHVYVFRALAGELPAAQPVVGIRAWGLEAGEEPAATIEEMASRYLEEVKRRQPSGPYLLAGSSMGGMVAFEMARRLSATAEEVALLALLDTFGPGQLPEVGTREPAAAGERPRELAALAERRQAEYSGATAEAAARQHRTQIACVEAMLAFEPRPYDGALLFLRVRTRRAGDPPHPERAWIDLASGGVEVRVVPGDHDSLHQPPHVGLVARCLRERLETGLAAAQRQLVG